MRQGVDTSKFIPYSDRPTTVNGQSVITRDRAMSPHPHPRHSSKLVPTKGVTAVLLADGSEIYECDLCLKRYDGSRNCVAHLVSHNDTRELRRYAPHVVRTVLNVVVAMRRAGHRNYNEAAADQLNSMEIPTISHTQWSAGAVSNIVRSYAKEYKIKMPAISRKVPAPALAPAPAPAQTEQRHGDGQYIMAPADDTRHHVDAHDNDVNVSADTDTDTDTDANITIADIETLLTYLNDAIVVSRRNFDKMQQIVDGVQTSIADIKEKAEKYETIHRLLKNTANE